VERFARPVARERLAFEQGDTEAALRAEDRCRAAGRPRAEHQNV
jgi:hypothetical protein